MSKGRLQMNDSIHRQRLIARFIYGQARSTLPRVTRLPVVRIAARFVTFHLGSPLPQRKHRIAKFFVLTRP